MGESSDVRHFQQKFADGNDNVANLGRIIFII